VKSLTAGLVISLDVTEGDCCLQGMKVQIITAIISCDNGDGYFRQFYDHQKLHPALPFC